MARRKQTTRQPSKAKKSRNEPTTNVNRFVSAQTPVPFIVEMSESVNTMHSPTRSTHSNAPRSRNPSLHGNRRNTSDPRSQFHPTARNTLHPPIPAPRPIAPPPIQVHNRTLPNPPPMPAILSSDRDPLAHHSRRVSMPKKVPSIVFGENECEVIPDEPPPALEPASQIMEPSPSPTITMDVDTNTSTTNSSNNTNNTNSHSHGGVEGASRNQRVAEEVAALLTKTRFVFPEQELRNEVECIIITS